MSCCSTKDRQNQSAVELAGLPPPPAQAIFRDDVRNPLAEETKGNPQLVEHQAKAETEAKAGNAEEELANQTKTGKQLAEVNEGKAEEISSPAADETNPEVAQALDASEHTGGDASAYIGDGEEAVAHWKEQIEQAQQAKDLHAQGYAQGQLFQAYEKMHDFKSALAHLPKMHAFAIELFGADSEAVAHMVGKLESIQLQLQHAHWEQQLKQAQKDCDSDAQSEVHYNLSAVYKRKGDIERAFKHIQQAHTCYSECSGANRERAARVHEEMERLLRQLPEVRDQAKKQKERDLAVKLDHEERRSKQGKHDGKPALLTCMVMGCLNAIDETVCGSPYCAEHEHHPVGKASFEVARQVLIDIRESTGYAGWRKSKEGWDKLETYTTMEELGEKLEEGVHNVMVKDGKLEEIYLDNLTGTPPSLGAHSPPADMRT
jgi:tetratricopeptide (TPR) repeat protein